MNQHYQKILVRSFQYGVLVAIFFAGFWGYVLNTTNWFGSIPGDLIDARFNSIILEHILHWLQGKAPSIWSPLFFYPFENVLAFSDNHFGSFWAYAIPRMLGLQREYAFIVWFIIGNFLNFWVSYYVFRRLGFSVIASGAGAFVFTFALPALPKEAHAQLIYRFASPLSFLAFFNFIQSKKPTSFARLFFWLAVQFYCSIYVGIFLVYFLFTILVSIIFIQYQRLISGWRDGWAAQTQTMRLWAFSLFLFSALAILWLLYHYHAVSLQYGIKRAASEMVSMLPTPSSYLIADRSQLTSWIGSGVKNQLMRHELQMFFGLGTCILAAIGIWQIWILRSVYEIGMVALISLLLLIAMTISISGYSFYNWLAYLPGVGSIRAVSRIVLIMLLPLGILVAVSFDAVSRQCSQKIKWISLGGMTILLIVETLYYRPYNTSLTDWTDRQVAIKKMLPLVLPTDAILYVTSNVSSHNEEITEVDGVILAQDLGRPTLNGYSGNVPPGYIKPNPCMDFRDRIRSYFDFKSESASLYDNMVKRVVLISPEECPNQAAIRINQLFDTELATRIHLKIIGEIVDRTIQTQVMIKNESDEKISTISKRGPLRLSWRILSISADGQILNYPDFSVRKDLYFSLDTGTTHNESLRLDTPSQPGRYVLQASLVQEGVVWLHDVGMQIAEWPFEIK